MKKKYGLYILFVVLLAITAVILFDKRSGTDKRDENQFAVKDTGLINLVEIRSPDNTVILERMQGRWIINGHYSAGNKSITGLLKLISRLQVSAPVPGSIRSEITDKLTKDGKRIKIVTERKNPHVILMYHDTVHTNTTYMMMENSDQPFRVEIPGYPERNLARYFVDKVSYWRDNSIFRLREDEISSVSLYNTHDPEKSFHLLNTDNGYKLYTYTDSTEVPDIIDGKARQYLSYFSSVSFERFLSDNERRTQAGLNKDDPANIIAVTDSGNNVIQVKTFLWYVTRQDASPGVDLNRLIAIINNTDTVVVKYIELDPVIKDIGYFLEKEENNLYN
jgi:hypothetical protein